MASPSAESTPTRLHYFFGRGLGEQIRFMLAATGTEWEDCYLREKSDIEALRARGVLPWDQVPLLEIDGRNITQSMSAVRALARRSGLYGASEADAVTCDVLGDGIRDALGVFVGLPFASDRSAQLETARSRMVGKYLPCVERALRSNAAVSDAAKARAEADSGKNPVLPSVAAEEAEAAGAPDLPAPAADGDGGARVFLVGGSLTFPDVTLTELLCYVAETLPEVAATAGERWPLTVAHQRMMLGCARMRAFLSSSHRHPLGDKPYFTEVRKVLD